MRISLKILGFAGLAIMACDVIQHISHSKLSGPEDYVMLIFLTMVAIIGWSY